MFYITGTSDINLVSRITTIKYNSNGALQWARVYNGGGPGDISTDMVMDKQGNIEVSGGTQISNNVSLGLVIKYNPNGDSLWVRKFASLGQVFSLNSKILSDDSNSIYTAGYIVPSGPYAKYLSLKYNSSGNLLWFSTYDGPQQLGSAAYCFDIDTNRNVFVVGNNGSPIGISDNTLIMLGPSGTIQWASIYKGIGGNSICEYPTGISVSRDGSSIYYTTFCANGTGGGGYSIVTLKYNSLGDSVWTRSYSGGVATTQNAPAVLKLDKLGNCYVAGHANYQTFGDDYVVIKYLSNGFTQWIATYNGPLSNSEDQAMDIIIDTSFNVFVTGISSRQNNPQFLMDAATIKYNQPIGVISNNTQLPKHFKLLQNYPNPFNTNTIISYQIPKASEINLSLFNILGQYVNTIVDRKQDAGTYIHSFNMENLPSGVYFYKLTADGNIIDTKKLILIK
jgi:hypothetical protein